jgi:hypothetical protein
MQRMDHDIKWGAQDHQGEDHQAEDHHVKGGDYFGTAHGQK